MTPARKKTFMFLGYTDDSGRFDKKTQTYQVLATVLVHDKWSGALEEHVGMVVENLLPPEKWEEFEEFHAWELYRGCNIFEGIDTQLRFDAIRVLLSILRDYKMPVVYGGVDIPRLKEKVYASADPVDIAFRICVEGASVVMAGEQYKSGGTEFALLIVDDSNNDRKKQIKKTYRELRRQIRPPGWHPKTWYLHDDIYFASSKDSVGIQIADLCSYFIGKHLEGDVTAEGFYQIFSDLIQQTSRVEPEYDEVHQRVQPIRFGNGGTVESTPQRNKEEAGSGERGKAKTEGGEG